MTRTRRQENLGSWPQGFAAEAFTEAPALITTPQEIAKLLIPASVGLARGFAVGMHGHACRDGGEHRATFWNDVRIPCPVVARSQAGW